MHKSLGVKGNVLHANNPLSGLFPWQIPLGLWPFVHHVFPLLSCECEALKLLHNVRDKEIMMLSFPIPWCNNSIRESNPPVERSFASGPGTGMLPSIEEP